MSLKAEGLRDDGYNSGTYVIHNSGTFIQLPQRLFVKVQLYHVTVGLLFHAVLATNLRIIFENTTQHNTFLNINFNRKCCPFHTKTHPKREKWRLVCSLMPSNMTSRARIRLHGGKILSI